jgi:hypothetical protein
MIIIVVQFFQSLAYFSFLPFKDNIFVEEIGSNIYMYVNRAKALKGMTKKRLLL